MFASSSSSNQPRCVSKSPKNRLHDDDVCEVLVGEVVKYLCLEQHYGLRFNLRSQD